METTTPAGDATDDGADQVTSELAYAARLLRGGALVAFVVWGVGLIATMALQWSQVEQPTFSFQNAPEPPPPLLSVLAVGLTQTWGYLLVAVVAFAAASLITASGAGADAGPAVPDGAGDRD